MPVLRPHAARFDERRISIVMFMSVHLHGNAYMWVGVVRTLADSSDFGLLGIKVPQNGRFAVLDAEEPPCNI